MTTTRRSSPATATRRFIVAALCVVSIAACSNSTDVGQGTTTSNQAVETTTTAPTTTAVPTTTTESTTTTTQPPSTTTSTAPVLPTLEELQEIVDTTVELPRLSFELTADSTINNSISNTLTRTGWFDDGSFTGDGRTEFSTTDESSLGLPPFEFRLVDNVFWTLTPVEDPSVWIGRDVFEMAQQEGDPTGSIDGDAHLWLIMEAATAVTDYADDGNGTQDWQLDVSADLMLFSFSGGGAAQRIVEAGGGETGITESLRLTVTDGLVTEAFVDLSTWWNEAIRISLSAEGLPALPTTDTASLSLTFAPYEDARPAETPCADPTTRVDTSGIEYLRC